MDHDTPSHDITSIDDIRELIDSFYLKVKADDLLGFIFNDVAHVDWDHHLPKMYAFWEFLLLGGDAYQGNPMEPHKRLHEKIKLRREYFERWVTLFKQNVDEHFTGHVAEEAKNKAMMIALTWIPKFQDKTIS